MGEDWKELDVIPSLQTIENPPHSMWLHGEDVEGDERESRSAKILEHYNELLEVLRHGGYERLLKMKERLESHVSEVEDRLLGWRGRALHSQLQYKAYRERLLDLADKRTPEDAEIEKVEDKRDALLDSPIGEPWFTGGAVEFDSEGNWKPGLPTHHPDSEATLSDMIIKYEATEDALPQYGLHQRYEEYATASFRDEHTHTFTGDTKWREAFETLEKNRNVIMKRKNRVVNTNKLLRFRLSIIETILYRFEAFGSVEEMTEEDAHQAAQNVNEREGTPIGGYYGADYAADARDVLKANPTITSFSGLKREMGESKVDTVKRNVGYDDLSREVKEEEGFQRFESMLKEKVEQMEEN